MNTKPPQKIWTEHYQIPSYLVNLRGKAGLFAMLNLLQDAGWKHAFDWNLQLPEHQGFVFTRQKLMMKTWPSWNDKISIRTWIRPPSGAFLFRDYEIYHGEEKIGEGTGSFVVIDLKTRKPAKSDWSSFEQYWRQDFSLNIEPEKISTEGDFKEVSSFPVRNSDLDMNDHVNNTKYAQWVLDSLPIEILRGPVHLHGYEVNFLAEAKLGDEIAIRSFHAGPGPDDLNSTHFQGIRTSDQRPIFTARLISDLDSVD